MAGTRRIVDGMLHHGRRQGGIPAAWAILVAVALLVPACEGKLSGPAPTVGDVTPRLACGEQIVTAIRIDGTGLSPMGIDVAKDTPHLDLPRVTLLRVQALDGSAVTGAVPIEIPNDPYHPEAARVRWTDRTVMAFDVYPELALTPGLYEVTVANPNGHHVTLAEAVVIVPRPTLSAIVPDLACTEQGARAFTVKGEGFLHMKGTGALPRVTVSSVASGTVTVDVEALTDCAALPGRADAETCRTGTITLPMGAPDPTLVNALEGPDKVDVQVTNPDPGACHSEDAITMAIVPPPSLAAIQPDLACVAQGERVLTLTGTNFVDVAGDTPDVAFGTVTFPADAATDCVAIAGTLLDAGDCTTLAVTVPKDGLAVGAHDVVVTNPQPAGCLSVEGRTIAVVPPPRLDKVAEDLQCLDEEARVVTLSGAGFVTVGTDLPIVKVGTLALVPDGAEGCEAIAGTLLDAKSCATLTVTLPKDALEPGMYEVTVTNPDPAGCVSTEPVTLVVAAAPTVTSVDPDLICTADGGATITVTGTGFLTVGGALPTIRLGDTAVTATGATGCGPVAGTTLDVQECTTLTATVPPDAPPPGTWTVSVENPPPAGCRSVQAVTLALVAPPVITAVAPAAVCATAQVPSMTLTGTGFLVVGGTQPTVLVDGTAMVLLAVEGCTDVPGTHLVAKTCTTITFQVPSPGGFAMGSHDVQVVNPPPAPCGVTAVAAFVVAPAPTVTDVQPFKVCVEDGHFTVTGSEFVNGSSILLDGSIPVDTTYVSGTEIAGVVNGGTAGLYDVTVQNGPGCEGTLPDALLLVNAPVVFFVDPPVVYNGINLQVTVHASGISGAVQSVGLRPSGTTDTPTPLAFVHDLARPNRILAVIPAGTPAGLYDVVVVDELCTAVLKAGVTVSDTLAVDVTAMEPPFGWVQTRTGVTIRAGTPPKQGFEDFLPTPRAYLNPVEGGDQSRASELKAVAFVDEATLTAVVPEGLPIGAYDLVVINPDGRVGLLPSAFRVTALPPPDVADLSPRAAINKPAQVVAIVGTDFRGPSVVATCRDAAGGETVLPATLGAVTATSIQATWDLTGLAGGEVCVVRVTNDDGTYVDFSALSVLNPSANLNTFRSATDMVTARRALAAATVRVNAAARYAFAIGGDGGAGQALLASVEGAPVDPYGALGAWTIQRNALPAARDFATAAVLGRFVYLVGGNDGTGPLASVMRAWLMDPLEVPVVKDIDLQLRADGTGLAGGVWYYRVAPVMAAADANNPGGEGLPSEPLVVQLPDLSPRKVALTFWWTATPGAVSYRIYRTSEPGRISGEERLLAVIPAEAAPTFTDDGSGTVDVAALPLPPGSLGTWHPVATMLAAREGVAVTTARDPADAAVVHLYACGGRDAVGTARNDCEHLSIRVSGPNAQEPGAVWAASGTLPTGRWQCGAVTVDSIRAPIVPAGESWIYVLPGKAAGGAKVGEVDAFRVEAGGGLSSHAAVDALNTGYAGYGAASGNGYLYLFGASSGSPSKTGHSAHLAAPVPTLDNWNAGQALVTPRYLHASSVESSFVYLLGGQTDTEAATRSTERTNM